MLTPDQVTQLRTQAGLSPIPPTPGTPDVISQRRAALGVDTPPPTPPRPNLGNTLMDIPKNWWENVGQSTNKIVSSIGEGANTIESGANDLAGGNVLGGLGKIAGGTLHGVAGGVQGAAGAIFAPLTATAKAITPKTGNPLIDDTTQSVVAGAPFGPAAAIINGGLTLLGHARSAIENSPALSDAIQKHPEIASTINDIMDTAVLAYGGKSALEHARAGGTDIMTAPLKEVPGMAAENIKNTVKPLVSLGQTIGTKAAETGQNVIEGARGMAKKLTNSDGSDKSIIENYTKAIKPSVSGKGTSAQIDNYNKNVVTGVRRIVQNEPNLEFANESGQVDHRLPETPKEMSDAISQTKSKIYQEYNARQQMAGMTGAKVDLSPIAQELSKVASDPVMQDTNPAIAQYAESRAKALSQRGSYTTDQAQQAVELYNKSLEAFYKNPSYDTATRAAVDAMIANKLRSGLDNVIENAHEGDGQSYKDLKREYGALKSMEKDVAHRAVVSGRASPYGFFDLGNIASAAELVRGIATMNPVDIATSAGIKGISAFMKWRNSPDTLIKNMFKGAKASLGNQSNAPSGDVAGLLTASGEVSNPASIAKNTNKLGGKLTSKESIANEGHDVNSPPKKSEGAIPATKEYSQGSKRTVAAFNSSRGQEQISKKFGVTFEYGDFAKNHDMRKLIEEKSSRFAKQDLKNTINNIVDASRASNDPTSYRSDNIAWRAVMPDGQERFIYTRRNAAGAEEILGYHANNGSSGIDPAKYRQDLQSYGAPDQTRTGTLNLGNSSPIQLGDRGKTGVPTGSRTQALSLEPSSSNPLSYRDNAKIPQEAIPRQASVFKGFRDLTTKILDTLKGKSTVSKQFIEDLTNQANLKQPERDLIRSVVADEKGTVNVKDFANKVKTELLPLKRVEIPDPRYEAVSLPEELRGPVANYSEHMYDSPIQTSAGGVHFGKDEANYFAHTRVEDLAPSRQIAVIEEGLKKGYYSNEGRQGRIALRNELADLRSQSRDTTRRVIELQSDLFQKGNLEKEASKGFGVQRNIRGDGYDIIDIKGNEVAGGFKTSTDAEEHLQTMLANQNKDISKLEPYRNTWQERIIREEVKQAAKDGKTKLQFPTGETAMKIEGLGARETTNWEIGRLENTSAVGNMLVEPKMKVGLEINNGGSDWIITDVLGDGKFSAVPKSALDSLYPNLSQSDALKAIINRHASRIESFDISGKVDTNNPIYKFYEKEVGRYLKNKYDAQMITDPQGVKWWQVNVPKSAKRLPVEAFAAAGLIPTKKKK